MTPTTAWMRRLCGAAAREIAANIMQEELQQKVADAGIEILDVRITHLAYAPEIAAAMLQRQQAVAVIAARQKIVEGAVGMVEMALDKLSENNVVELDDEAKSRNGQQLAGSSLRKQGCAAHRQQRLAVLMPAAAKETISERRADMADPKSYKKNKKTSSSPALRQAVPGAGRLGGGRLPLHQRTD